MTMTPQQLLTYLQHQQETEPDDNKRTVAIQTLHYLATQQGIRLIKTYLLERAIHYAALYVKAKSTQSHLAEQHKAYMDEYIRLRYLVEGKIEEEESNTT